MCVEVHIEGLHVLYYAAVSVFKLGALSTAPSDVSILRPNNRERKLVMYQYVPSVGIFVIELKPLREM